LRTHAGGVTDPGRVRSYNEDYFEWREPEARAGQTWRALYVVADGVGGAAAGDQASRVAVETFVETYYASSAASTEEALRAATVSANAAVFESARGDGRATTLVAAAVVGDVLQVANVGDSRLYLVRAGQIRQITRDHSWVQEQVRAGRLAPEDASTHPRRNVVTRWLGQRSVEPDLFGVELEVGDRGADDRIENAVDYRDVAAVVREIADGRFRLLEALASTIADTLIERFPVERAKVRVRKPEVRPSGVDLEFAAVTVERP